MSSICGWTGCGGGRDDPERQIRAMGRQMCQSKPGESRIIVRPFGALCIHGGEPLGNLCEQDGAIAALSGRFNWTSRDLAEIAGQHGNASALLQGFEKYGPDVVTNLSGTFIAIVICESENQFLLATDRKGATPIAYAEVGDTVVFGPESSTLIVHPSVDSRTNPQAFFDYIYFHVIPAPESVYGEVRRLLPGQYLHRSDGCLSITNYWRAIYDESFAGRSFTDLQEELVSLVRASVASAANVEAVGAFLSGGVDSSTITGVLGLVRGEAPRTYTIGFDVDGYDELAFARLAATHFGAQNHEYRVTPEDVVEAVPKIAAFYSEPFGNSSAVPSYFCAKLAKEDGIQMLLGGDGGDELFGGNSRYADQKLFEAYYRIPAALRSRLLEPMFLSSRFGRNIAPIHKIRRYIQQAVVPMPNRLQTYNFLNVFAPEQIFDSAFLEQVSERHPLTLLTDVYEDVSAESIVDKMLGLDLKFTLADNDLVKVSGTCELAGLEVAYPLLSDELIEFSARLPARLKVNGRVLRYFFKKAYSGFLPNEVLKKSKHGFGLPFGEWAVSNRKLNVFVRDNLESLKTKRLIRADFIDKLMGSYLPGHPQYYGGIVWLLLMLEQWHQQHMPD